MPLQILNRTCRLFSDYLDEAFEGSRRLWAMDAFSRAQQKMLLSDIMTKVWSDSPLSQVFVLLECVSLAS